MELDSTKVKTADDARQLAIEWQHWASDQDLSYAELSIAGTFFNILAYKYHLINEFKENGVI